MKVRPILTKWARLALLAILPLLIFGCASVRHVNSNDATIDLSENSVLLLKFTTNNTIAPNFKPRIDKLTLKNISNNKTYRVYFPSSGVDIGQDDKTHHWLSVYLPAGYYKVERIAGHASAILMNGQFDFPTTINFNLPERSVVYAGSFGMTLRNLVRDSSEQRAGSILPLIDQTASGFGKGTFDITVSDNNEDAKAFKLRKPALATADIVKSIATMP
jgi:hypothetical protein